MKILRYDLAGRTLQTVYEEQQACWIDFFENNDFLLLADESLLLRSSKDGWFHIYRIANGRQEQSTSGPWSVKSVEVADRQKDLILFSAAKEDSTETDFYRTSFKGGTPRRLSTEPGTHSVTVSPRGSYFIDRHSNLQTPERLELFDLGGRLTRILGESRSAALDKYGLAKVELFRIPTEDGYKLPALWYLPAELDRSKKYPVIMFEYGGPGSQDVANRFAGDIRKHFLAQEGIISLAVDHRGSSHFGKQGMERMYRNLGKWEMNDYIQAVKYLRTLPFVDPERIGITGGSYGGYVTALALTCASDYFKYGIAESSVIDWALYDSVYTERYMGLPAENPEGYQSSSVLNYIDKYRGGLRITHGSLDDNVHMQNTIQFISRVLDAGKTVELMIYPGDRHGLRGAHRQEDQKSNLNFWFRSFYGKKIAE